MPDTPATSRRQARVERRLRFLLIAHAFFNPDNREEIHAALNDPDAVSVALHAVAAERFAGTDGAIDWEGLFAKLLELLPIIIQLLMLFMSMTPTET